MQFGFGARDPCNHVLKVVLNLFSGKIDKSDKGLFRNKARASGCNIVAYGAFTCVKRWKRSSRFDPLAVVEI